MLNRRQAGMTLVELIVAIVIINVGLAGVMLTFVTVVRSSAQPMIYKQMAAVAEGLMEEIMLKPFARSAPAPAPGVCARDTHNDVRDYAGYHAADACTVEGDPIAALAGYQVEVAVTAAGNAAMPGVPAGELLKIDIAVRTGTASYVLTGWRTCYGGPPCL